MKYNKKLVAASVTLAITTQAYAANEFLENGKSDRYFIQNVYNDHSADTYQTNKKNDINDQFNKADHYLVNQASGKIGTVEIDSGTQYGITDSEPKFNPDGMAINPRKSSELANVITNYGNLETTLIKKDAVLQGNYFVDQSGTADSIQNAGLINGGILNNGVIANSIINGDDAGNGQVNVIQNNGTVGNILNKGIVVSDIENKGTVNQSIENDGTIKGDLINSGKINGKENGIANTGTILGSLVNNAQVSGSVTNSGKIENGIFNKKQIDGSLINTGTVENGILNSGTIKGGVVNSGVINGGFKNTGGIDGKFTNTGIINDGLSLGNFKGELINTGAITGDIDSSETFTLTNDATYTIKDGGLTSLNTHFVNNNLLILNPTSHSAGNTLSVASYDGKQNSVISVGTILGGGDSLTDKLEIRGAATGTSTVIVNNENGKGGKTEDGIQIISYAQGQNATFIQGNRISAGLFDYKLDQKTDGVYLDSAGYRPEIGGFTSNIQANNTLFNTSLHDRLGETRYIDPQTGQLITTSLWIHNSGGHNRFSMDGGLKTTANRYVVQIGGDIGQWNDGNQGSLRIGVMGGYGNQKSNTDASRTGLSAKSEVSGYSAGLYGIWYQNDLDKTGFFVDSWALYNWFNNTVKSNDEGSISYDSKGITASVEGGYTLPVATYTNSNLYVEPSLQVTYMGVEADDTQLKDGTTIASKGDDNVQTRLGMRTYLKGSNSADKGTGLVFEPFIEASWIYNSKNYGVSSNGYNADMNGTHNIGEVKTGIEAKLHNNVNLWAAIGQQIGDKSYSDSRAAVGVKYIF
ncbi:autotransporter outer membrane beta-barrel domain-containing protein (plasmid) [Kosakonia sp. SMBL-WEM22]|uniref:autotransporter outer membrane beta-barrel domain-containing protein n=1 Tax=Kosakonia sp. SMBL-WEM22 TaxID=2725560 RepID=UPI001658F17A|nr:autotransporter outer membrane beta-barrel domain-containing protein [Kosakonia sp. SMBL-WEM22]QNQ22933.1 autotransporter outer membrane beta-barrel domain-containing protein [Kosakonia sp. SMBL-WEM22]